MSKVVRSVKNVTKGYSSVQVKVRNGASVMSTTEYPRADPPATSNDPWGPTGTDMAEISSMTFGR